MFKHTDRLRPAALHFIKYGFYTEALKGTKDYFDYWDAERERCLYGYEIDELKITGFHYFYLNYCPIDRSVEEVLPDGTKIARRERTFPAFETTTRFLIEEAGARQQLMTAARDLAGKHARFRRVLRDSH